MRRVLTVSSLAAAMVFALVSVSLGAGESPVVTGEILAKVAQMLADRSGDYAGSDVCLVCHELPAIGEEYLITTWQNTLHAQPIRDPDQDPGVLPDNDFKVGLDLSTDPDFSQYGANAPVLSYDGADPADPADFTSGYRVTIGAITYTVNRTHGGYWKQRFQTKIGNSFYYLPIQYNKKTADWVVFHGSDWYDGSNLPLYTDPATLAEDINKTTSFERKCAACHVTGLELTFDEGTSEYIASFRELNIGCEACHGPGGAPTHVLYGLSGKGLDPSILDADRGNEVCGQCHNRGQGALAVGGNTLGYPWGVDGGFTPGDVLDDYFIPVNPTDDPNRFWPDGVHSKSHRQQYLDFYQSSKPTFQWHQVVCWECHDPHGSANKHDIVESIEEDGVIIPTENDNNTLCLACHATHGPFADLTEEMIADYEGNLETIAAVVSAHTKHPYDPENANSTGGSSRCSKCHMPKVAKSAVAYDIHAHTFEAIPGQKTLETQADGGMPNACAASCHRNSTQPNLPDFGITDETLTAWNEPSDTAVAVIVQGNQDQWASDTSRYAGVDYCDNCHGQVSAYAGDQWEHWVGTGHAEAYDALPFIQENPECLGCHTTGWDTLAPNGGFDDFFYAGDEEGIQEKKNVQCESCHKLGSRHPIPEFETVEVNYSADLCGYCHQGAHQPTLEEWTESEHATSLEAAGGFVTRDASCAECHVAQSIIQYFEGEEVTLPDEPEPVSCAACHDPHSAEKEHQLRFAVEQICAECHSAEGKQPGDTPHHPNADMFEGTGGYEYEGEVYGNSPHTFVVTEKCVVCHMWTREYVSEDTAAVTGHTFEPVIEACQAEGCHPGLETFDRNGVQTEIDSLLNVLENALAAVEDSTTEDFINALFNYEFVTNDGSKGVHNTAYAKKLLWDSIESLTGEAPMAQYAGVEYCNNCHGNESSVAGTQYAGWVGTRHAVAYDAEGRADLPYWIDPCNKCHTAGYDSEVDNGGFDEAVTADDSLRTKNVQCEACHGPGSLHPGEFASIHLGLEADVCAECHYLANQQWSESKHAVSTTAAGGFVAANPACQSCHVGEVFLGESVDEEPTDITCAVCHDPHDASVSGSQLRYAAREICQLCHNAEGAEPGDTPYHPQAEMLEGVGGYEYPDQTYISSPHTVVVPEKCVTCHMYSEEFASAAFTTELSDHTFLPRLEACQECHPGLDTFDKDGVQTEIDDLLTALGDALAAASPEDSLTDSFKYALFNYEFVSRDGSRGVHNTTYARKLLEDALADFAPGFVGMIGDVNDDGGINVVDAITAVNIVLTIEEPTWDRAYRADCNRDGGVNIMDVVGIVNVTLSAGACPPATAPKGTYQVATVGASEMVVTSHHHFELPLFVDTEVDLAGAQFTVRYDPGQLTPETPQVTSRTAGMTVSSKADDGALFIALYSTDGTVIPSGAGSVVTVPFRVNASSAESYGLDVDEVVLAANCAEAVPVEVLPIALRSTELVPDVYALGQNYPNPFNPETEIDYAIPTSGMVRLTVYNILGQVVRVLVNTVQEAGYYTVRWDGTNEVGTEVVSGVYLYRIEAGSFVSTKKMTLVR